MSINQITHLDDDGKANMVDVGDKEKTKRFARASAQVRMSCSTLQKIKDGMLKKGDILSVAQIAGILGGKMTTRLIPLCHPIMLDHIDVKLAIDETIPGVKIIAEASAFEKTGVEMEALTAASVAALTVYDMVKSVEKSVVIEKIHLMEKWGGKSGHFIAEEK